jgi:hypothetical protein
MIEIHQNKKIKLIPIIDMFDAKTSTTTVNEEQPIIEPQKRSIRAKRRTNDEVIKKIILFTNISLI